MRTPKITIHNHFSTRDAATFSVGTRVSFKGRVGKVEGDGPEEGMTVVRLDTGKSVVAENSYLRKI